MLTTKGMRFPIDVILVCIRWYAAYPLSYRHLEEMMEERGVFVDHSPINRWAIQFLPLLEKVFRQHKRAVGDSWRMDETYYLGQRCLEIPVPCGRQGRKNGRLSADGQA
ncbi:MAG: family transposase [Polaromonas sp.]|nr:family transposase [Polaromonas sp.]